MTGHHDKSSEMDRRASMRRSIRYSTASAVDDDDDDDYDMMAMGISDGFRPTDVAQQHVDNPFNDPSDYEPTPAPAPAPAPPQRPSSISKPRRQQDSFSLRHDGGMGQLNGNPPLARTPSSSSSASSSSVIRPESPYQGPSGPSFPYQMYPQDVRLARTASLATTSTAPISERSYNGPRGPTHPYQMYPQNTVSAVDAAEERPAPAAIPVGFPGARDNYQRRLGPDGEEMADMIGPDGHTEQLPPYTRYPDEAYARKALAVEAAAVAAAASAPPQSPPPQVPTSSTPAVAAPAAGVPAAAAATATAATVGQGTTTRDPEIGSREDVQFNDSPLSRHSVRSFQSQSSVSQHDPSAAAMGPQVDEKQQPQLTGWQRAAKRKVWGVVPCWAIALTAMVLAMLAIVLGAILGTFFGKHGNVGPSLPGSSSDTTPSITIDAVPLPTVPPGLSPLAEGEYNLPLMLTRSPSTCFNDTTQAQAWNCNIIPYSLLSLDIKFLPGEPATSQYSASINFNSSYTLANNVFQYGMQPPSIQDVQLILVNDTYETSRGPAWAFELPYNKTVVIPESFFPTASSSSVVPMATQTGANKRSHVGEYSRVSSSSDFGADFKRKGLARPGDKPWICHWGGTILETFIYASQNSSRNPIVTSSSASMSSSTSSADPNAATDPYNPNAARAFPPPGFTGPPSGDEDVTATATSTVTKTSTTDPFAAPTPSSSSYWKSSYPRVVKVEERRMAGPPSRAPYCRQYELDENGGATAVRDEDGKLVELTIAEEEMTYSSTFSSKPRIRRRDIEEYLGHSLDARDVGNDMSNCGCMWWLT